MSRKTLAARELSKCQAQKLIAATETAHAPSALVSGYAGVEVVPRQEVHELGKDQLTGEHTTPLATKLCR